MSKEDVEIPHPSLIDYAQAGLPLSLPWFRQTILVGTGLASSRLNTDSPWAGSSAFDVEAHSKCLTYDSKIGCRASYRHSESSSHESTTDHYSGSLGLSVNTLCVKANVTGKYDSTVTTTTDSHKISQTSFIEGGCVQFTSEPQLTYHAQLLLSSSREYGPASFQAYYGDYYVAAMRLGGDSGAFMSVTQTDTEKIEKETLTISVKVLFFKPLTHEESHTHVERTKHLEFTFAAYDTLAGQNATLKSLGGEALQQTNRMCTEYLDKGNGLVTRVDNELQKLGLVSHQTFSMDACAKICQSGLVVSLICLPYHTLRGYHIALARAK